MGFDHVADAAGVGADDRDAEAGGLHCASRQALALGGDQGRARGDHEGVRVLQVAEEVRPLVHGVRARHVLNLLLQRAVAGERDVDLRVLRL